MRCLRAIRGGNGTRLARAIKTIKKRRVRVKCVRRRRRKERKRGERRYIKRSFTVSWLPETCKTRECSAKRGGNTFDAGAVCGGNSVSDASNILVRYFPGNKNPR